MLIIGIPMRYNHLVDGRCILYLGERIRRTIQKAGGFVLPIVQVQDVDYCDTKGMCLGMSLIKILVKIFNLYQKKC